MSASLFATQGMFHALGPASFGLIYFTLVANLLITTAFDLGISTTIVREVARGTPTEPAYIRDLLKTAALLYWGLYLALVIAALVLAPVIAHHFLRLPASSLQSAATDIRLLSVGALLGLPRTFYASVCRGLQRLDYANAVDVVTLGAQQIGIVVLVARGVGLDWVLIWISLLFAVNVAAYVCVVAHLLGNTYIVPGYRPNVVARNLRFASRMIGMSSLIAFHTQTDRVSVGRLLPIAIAGEYAVTAAVMQRAAIAPSAIAQAAFPAFAASLRDEDLPGARLAYKRLQVLMCVVTAVVFGGLAFVAPLLYRYILDDHVARALGVPTAVLALGYFLNAAITLPYVFSLAANRADIMMASHSAALILATPVAVTLIALLGLTGAGLSWVWFHIVTYAIGGRRIARECLGESFRRWLAEILVIGGPAVAIDACGLSLLNATGNATSVVAIATGAACISLYLATLFGLSTLAAATDLRALRISALDLLARAVKCAR